MQTSNLFAQVYGGVYGGDSYGTQNYSDCTQTAEGCIPTATTSTPATGGTSSPSTSSPTHTGSSGATTPSTSGTPTIPQPSGNTNTPTTTSTTGSAAHAGTTVAQDATFSLVIGVVLIVAAIIGTVMVIRRRMGKKG